MRECPTVCAVEATCREKWPGFNCTYGCHQLHKSPREWSHLPYLCTGQRFRLDWRGATVQCYGCTYATSIFTENLDELYEYMSAHWQEKHEDLL